MISCAWVLDNNILLSNTVNRNAKNVPTVVVSELIQVTELVYTVTSSLWVSRSMRGGETADVGDITPTLSVDSSAFAVLDRRDVINNNNIRPGLSIIGLASYGRAAYEHTGNSGIGCNGLTSARHDFLSSYYKEKYPETFNPRIPSNLVYSGIYKLEDPLPESSLTIGQALLSPTRTYAPVLAKLFREHWEKIIGLVHCSDGGQTKCLRFGHKTHFVKDNFLPIPLIFKATQSAAQTSFREMFQVFNIGHRMEIYCEHRHADLLLSMIGEFNIDAAVIGHTEASDRSFQKNHLTIVHDREPIEFSL